MATTRQSARKSAHMKLAEALLLRADLQKKIASLRERLTRTAVVQEGDCPVKDPANLLKEVGRVASRLERFIFEINRVNLENTLDDGRPLTAALPSMIRRTSAAFGFLVAAAVLGSMLGCNTGAAPAAPPANLCAGNPCDDGDLCTADACWVVGGQATCANEAVDCGEQVCNPADGECVDCVEDVDCDDGEFCDGDEYCTADNTCAWGGSPCAAGETCDEDNDQCFVICTDDASCDDGLFCNGAETCSGTTGLCAAGTAPCAAGETCDEDTDTCVGAGLSGEHDDMAGAMRGLYLWQLCEFYEWDEDEQNWVCASD